jgi:N-acetylmuramoyl-L-alanine amidase
MFRLLIAIFLASLLASLLSGCAMEGKYIEMPENVVPLRRGDAEVLARTLYGEARGEGISGMTAIAWVVVNRVRRPGNRFPDTVAEVCRSPHAFSCWSPSDANAKLCSAVTEADPSFALALYIAMGVLTGQIADNTGGADHYFAASMKTWPSWAAKMRKTARIGGHVFFREEQAS